jgi:hypothetical protein
MASASGTAERPVIRSIGAGAMILGGCHRPRWQAVGVQGTAWAWTSSYAMTLNDVLRSCPVLEAVTLEAGLTGRMLRCGAGPR